MALNKIYDTPFERLCLEDTLEEYECFDTLEDLAECYQRAGYLNIGDEFFNYTETDKYKRLIIGQVVDKYTGRASSVEYRIKDINIYFREANELEIRNINLDESKLNKVKMLGTPAFHKKEFIPYNEELVRWLSDESLRCYIDKGTAINLCIYSQYVFDEICEKAIIDCIIDMVDIIYKHQKRINSMGEDGDCEIDVIDENELKQYFANNKYNDIETIIKIPNTNKYFIFY